MKGKIKRNGFVDILRLVFSLLIVEFHFYESGKAGHLPLGKLGVEFFVIVSGFLFYASWQRRFEEGRLPTLDTRLDYWKGYMVKRYLRFFWPGLFAFIGYFVIERLMTAKSLSVATVANYLSSDIWEILLLKMSGLNRNKLDLLNNPAWTLSSMLIAEFFILGMLVWNRKLFLSFFMPASMLATLGYWINMDKAEVARFLGLFTFGTLRVYFLSCCGILAYMLCRRISKVRLNLPGRVLLTAAEWCAILAVIWVIYHRNTRNWQYTSILLITLGIGISFSTESLSSKLIRHGWVTDFLGEYSMGLYMTHHIVRLLYQSIFPDESVRWELHKGSFFLNSCVLALLFTLFMKGFFAALPAIKKGLRRLLIAKEPAVSAAAEIQMKQ